MGRYRIHAIDDDQLIELLSNGEPAKAISAIMGVPKTSINSRVKQLKKTHECVSNIQLVVKLLKLKQ